jgi:hypothetical protein
MVYPVKNLPYFMLEQKCSSPCKIYRIFIDTENNVAVNPVRRAKACLPAGRRLAGQTDLLTG